MTPVSLDTSAIMRLLVQQPPADYQRTAAYFSTCLDDGVPVHVSELVLAEAYFALQYHYEIPKADALAMLSSFAEQSGVATPGYVREVLRLPNLATTKPGFIDRLIHAAARSSGHKLATLEKAASKLPGTVVL